MTLMVLVVAVPRMTLISATSMIVVAAVTCMIAMARVILMGFRHLWAALSVVPLMRLVAAVFVLLVHRRFPHKTLRSVCLFQPYTP